MEFINIPKSSNVASIGYDPDTEELRVAFKPHKEGEPGRVYSYASVPKDKYLAFLNAESVGSHFATFIRANYESHRIDSPKESHGEAKQEAAKQEAKPKKAKRIS